MTPKLPEPAEVRELIAAFQPLPRVRHQADTLLRLLADYERGLSNERRALTIATRSLPQLELPGLACARKRDC